jgi:hypothetical protein
MCIPNGPNQGLQPRHEATWTALQLSNVPADAAAQRMAQQEAATLVADMGQPVTTKRQEDGT